MLRLGVFWLRPEEHARWLDSSQLGLLAPIALRRDLTSLLTADLQQDRPAIRRVRKVQGGVAVAACDHEPRTVCRKSCGGDDGRLSGLDVVSEATLTTSLAPEVNLLGSVPVS